MHVRVVIRHNESQTRARIGEASLLLAVIVVLAAVGGASAASRAGTVHAATSTTLGTNILVDSRGFTLYHRTTEKKGSVNCIGTCRKSWPPLLVSSATPVAGAGLSAAKLGTIKRPDGGVQVTYNGYALYRYTGDKKAGQTNGQGAEGVWYALTPAGVITKAAPKPRSTSPSGTSSRSNPTGPKTTPTAPTGTTTVDSTGCPPGQTVAQGAEGGPNGTSDDDDDNAGGPDDGDGCL